MTYNEIDLSKMRPDERLRVIENAIIIYNNTKSRKHYITEANANWLVSRVKDLTRALECIRDMTLGESGPHYEAIEALTGINPFNGQASEIYNTGYQPLSNNAGCSKCKSLVCKCQPAEKK